MKKLISLLLAMIMVIGLAACGKTTPPAASSTTKPATSSTTKPAASSTTKPAASSTTEPKEPVTLTIGVAGKANITDYENNKLALWLEEQTGYNIEVAAFSSDSAERATQVATMVAANEKLPDIMYYFSLSAALRDQYGDEGYLLDVKPYFEDKEFMASLSEKYNFDWETCFNEWFTEDVKSRLFTEGADPEGRLFSFPMTGASITDQPQNMLYINVNWLDKLGLEMPTTPAELKTVLTAFVTKDPNGNGKADEMGMVGATGVARSDIPSWLINNWIYFNDYGSYLYNADDEGNVYIPYDRDEYREGLKYVRDLYDNKLIDQVTWTLKSADLPGIFTPVDEVAKVGVFAGHISLRVTEGNPVLFEYQPLLPFEGAYAAQQPKTVSYATHISGETEHPEEAFEVLFLLASPWGELRERYGEEGVDWEFVDPQPNCTICGGKGSTFTGKSMKVLQDAYAQQTDSTFANQGTGFTWYRDSQDPAHSWKPIMTTHQCEEPDDGEVTWKEYRSQLGTDHAVGYLAHGEKYNPKNIVYKLVFNQEETDARGDSLTLLKEYAKRMRAEFCTGVADVNDDKVWEEYKKTLYSFDWDVIVKTAQSAYDRMNGK